MMRVRSQQRRSYMGSEKFHWEEVKCEFTDPKVYLSSIVQFCQDILLYGFSTFLPAVLKSLGYDSLMSNVLTVPVYIWAALVYVVFAFLADRYSKFAIVRSLRLFFFFFFFFSTVIYPANEQQILFCGDIFGVAGYIILLASSNNAVKYFGTFLCGIATYTGPGLNMAWLNVNVAPQHRRALAIGLQQSFGNCAGIVAGQIYRKSPYVLGNAFSLGAMVVAQLVITGHALYLRRESAEKEKIARGEKEDTRRVQTGDAAVDFQYFY